MNLLLRVLRGRQQLAIFLLACPLASLAQTQRQGHCKLNFAATGQILSEPPTHLWQGGTLTFRITHSVGDSAVSPQLVSLIKQLVSTYFLLGSEDELTAQLQQAGFDVFSLLVVRKQYAATIRDLLTAYPMLKRELPQLKQVDWTAAGAGASRAITATAVTTGNSPLFAPALLHDACRLYLKAPYKAVPRHFKIAGSTSDTCIVRLHNGPMHFEIRRPTLDSLVLASPALQMPSELETVSFTSEQAALVFYKPLVEKANNYLKSNTSPDVVTLADIQKGIRRLNDEIELTDYAGYRTKATAHWLLQQLWRVTDGKLTATPGYKMQEDEWLYQGSIEVSAKSARYPSWQPWPLLARGLIIMRNHDAAQLYQLTNTSHKSTLAINEEQQMAIVLYNLSKKNKPATSVVLTPFTFDDRTGDAVKNAEYIFEEKGLTTFKLDSMRHSLPTPSPNPATNIEECNKLIELYAKLTGYMAPFGNWQSRVVEPGTRDVTPTFRTLEVPSQKPTEVPSLVKYTITDTLYPGRAVPGLPDFSYQQHKLYRFRIKAGIVYSELERRSYSINKTANKATRTTETVGLAAAVGLQLFVPRIDIQESRLVAFRPFLYAGYLLSGRVVDNLLLGGGLEPIPGLSLLGGWHLSTANDRLVQTNGLLEVKHDGFQFGYFVQMALGLTAFNTLFKTPTVSNPLAPK